jgi:Tol biopolymer transport system component
LVAGDTNGTDDIFVHDLQTGTTTRVSVDSSGSQSDNASQIATISADGRYVVFGSVASNLVVGDTNGAYDVFVHDLQTGTTTRVSVDSAGTEGNSKSGEGYISADGRYVVFGSVASNLVVGDTNGIGDLFVHDMQTGTTTRSSLGSTGNQIAGNIKGFSISSNNRYIVFSSSDAGLVSGDTNGAYDVFVRDLQIASTIRLGQQILPIAPINNGSYTPSISSDNRYIVFVSQADNLVVGDTNNEADIFVQDVQLNTITRISVDSSWNESNGHSRNPVILGDGQYVLFESEASNLVSNDTNNASDIFIRDVQNGSTFRVSNGDSGIEPDGNSTNALFNGDIANPILVFSSQATNLVADDTNGVEDVFATLPGTGINTRISVDSLGNQADGDSSALAISRDGRYVIFASNANNLVLDDTNKESDLFMHDMQTGITSRISVDSSGNESDGSVLSYGADISADGRYVVFTSSASNLVSGITDKSTMKVFIRDLQLGTTKLISANPAGEVGNNHSALPSLSPDGKYVVFVSLASDLVSGDTNNMADVFVYSVATGEIRRVSVSASGIQGDADSGNGNNKPVFSPDGNYILFYSDASNLVSGDTNGFTDVFVTPVPFFAPLPNPVPEPVPTPVTMITSSGRSKPWTPVTAPRSTNLVQQSNSTPISVDTCPADQILTQNMKAGAQNGKYHPYTKTVVREVKILQGHMNRLGFKAGLVDGILGKITDSAIKRMQVFLGTKADGFIGPVTRGLINKSCGASGLQKS